MRRKATLPPIAWAALAAAALAVAGPAAAQVLEIGSDGGVTRYVGPAVYTDEGARSLLLQAASATAAPAGVAPPEVTRAIEDSAQRHAVWAPLAEAVAWQESRFHQNAVSPKGALGVMQLMPGTARRLGVDAQDLKGNIDGGVAYLGQMLQRFEGDLPRALAAYNAGPEAVTRYGGVPPYAETLAYVRAVLDRLPAIGVGPISLARLGAE
jgi:soluble lytic murein transglycosylase-like protein